MLFDSLREKSQRLYRQGKASFYRHLHLSAMWARPLLGAKEKTFSCLVLIGWFFPEFYGEQLFVMAAAVAAAFMCYAPYRWSLKCLLIYHIISASLFLAFRDTYRPDVAMAVDLAMSRVLLFEVVLLLAVGLFYRISLSVFGLLAVVGSIITLFGSGLTYVTTMNSTFLAVLLPFVPPIFLPLTLIAIFLQKGALAYGIVALHLLVYGIYFKSRIYLGCFLGGMGGGGWYLGSSIFCADRSLFYQWAINEWLSADRFFGSGMGSFQVLGPLLQKSHEFGKGQYWLSLHSDWLQALVETGALGIVLLLWVFFDFLYRNRKEPILFSTMLALGGAGCFYYPFKIPIFALVFAVLTAEGMRCQTKLPNYKIAKPSE